MSDSMRFSWRLDSHAAILWAEDARIALMLGVHLPRDRMSNICGLFRRSDDQEEMWIANALGPANNIVETDCDDWNEAMEIVEEMLRKRLSTIPELAGRAVEIIRPKALGDFVGEVLR